MTCNPCGRKTHCLAFLAALLACGCAVNTAATPGPAPFPSRSGVLSIPQCLEQTPLTLYSIHENFPLLTDVLRLPVSLVDTLKSMDDESLKGQLDQWDQEQPGSVRLRMYEDAQHINTWFRRLMVLEVLAGRATDLGRFATEELAAFYARNAGPPLLGITLEPRRSIVSALAIQAAGRGQVDAFYKEITELPPGFAVAYQHLVRGRYALAGDDQRRADLLRDLARVLLQARAGAALTQVGASLAAYSGLAEDRTLYAWGRCLTREPDCPSLCVELEHEGVVVPAGLAALAQAAQLPRESETADPGLCAAVVSAGYGMLAEGFSGETTTLADEFRQPCHQDPAYWGLAMSAGIMTYGPDSRLTAIMGSGSHATPLSREFLAAAIYADYLLSLPLLFTADKAPTSMDREWFFRSGTGKDLAAYLDAYGAFSPDTRDLITLVLNVLALNGSGADQESDQMRQLRDRARELSGIHPDNPLFARLFVMLKAQEETAALEDLLTRGPDTTRKDPVVLTALLPHILALLHQGKPVPAWYEEALAAMDDQAARDLRESIDLFHGMTDPAVMQRLASDLAKDLDPEGGVPEEKIKPLSLRLFNIKALAVMHGVQDPPFSPSAGQDHWPLDTYWNSPRLFPGLHFFEGIAAYGRKDLPKAKGHFLKAHNDTSSRAEKMAASWWLARVYLDEGEKEKAAGYAMTVVNSFDSFPGQVLFGPGERRMVALFDAAFDFVMKPEATRPGNLSLDLNYRFTPRFFPLPEGGYASLKKLVDTTVEKVRQQEKKAAAPTTKPDKNRSKAKKAGAAKSNAASPTPSDIVKP